MKSVFLLCSALAVSDASECQADGNSLLQVRQRVRETTLLEGSDTTMTTDEVNNTLATASQANSDGSVDVRIWTSQTNTKCVDVGQPLICARDAGDRENRVPPGGYHDTFDITTNGNEVCARRTDHNAGWGMGLVIRCQPAVVVTIWTSQTNTKCVDAGQPVICARDAGNRENRSPPGGYGDTFDITTPGGNQVCARRTDHNAGWGMGLVVRCQPAVDIAESQCTGSYQAEDARISGGVVHANTRSPGHAGFTGSSFVDYVNRNDDFVEWTVDSCSGGTATLSFRYALARGNRPLEVGVNGEVVERRLSFPATGNWATWGLASVEVQLQAGTNVVKLKATGSSGANMDSLIIGH